MTQINVIFCKDCRYFRPIPDAPYGTCHKQTFHGAVVKETDYCSYADYPLPIYDDHNESGLLEE